jgi:hypothetical protein
MKTHKITLTLPVDLKPSALLNNHGIRPYTMPSGSLRLHVTGPDGMTSARVLSLVSAWLRDSLIVTVEGA